MNPRKEHEASHRCRVITIDLGANGEPTRIECVPRSGPGMRDLFVDVQNCKAAIAEMVDNPDGSRSVRFLDLTQLSRDDLEEALVTIDEIVCEENRGAFSQSGHYRAQTDESRQLLARFVILAEHSAESSCVSPWSY